MEMNRKQKEELLLLQDELIRRREDDPIFKFEPTGKQLPFIEALLGGETRLGGFLGANRSGKSQIGAYVGSHLARFGPPEKEIKTNYSGSGDQMIMVKDRATSGWVASLDFSIGRDVIQPKYFDNGFTTPGQLPPFIPDREIKEWRTTDQILKLKNGSIIGFKSCDSDVKKFQGTGKDWIHFDEEPPKTHFDEATIRVEAGRRLTVFFTCTLLPPVGEVGGMSWMFNEFIQPWKEGKRKDLMLFGSSIYDNPYIGKDEVRYLEAMYPEGSVSRRIRLEGEWLPGIGGSRTYPAFDRQVHVKDLGRINPHLPVSFIWDFNVSPMITLVGQRDKEAFRFYRELVLEDNANIPDMCSMFYDYYPDIREVWIYGDSTGTHRHHHAKSDGINTDYALIHNELRKYGYSVKQKVKPKNPLVMDRVNAVNRAFKDEFGEMNVEVDESCKELIDDFEQVLMDPKGGIKKSHNKNDPYYRRTHASDAGGYWIAYEAPVKRQTFGQRVSAVIKDVGYKFS